MTSLDQMVEEEFWDEVPSLSSALDSKMKELGDRAAELHLFLHGPGGRWDTRGDLICCF